MKISPRKYAQALAESLDSVKSETEVNERINSLLKMLVKRKESKLIKRLPELFKGVWLKRQGKMEMSVTMSDEISDSEKSVLQKLLKDAFKKDIDMSVKVENDIIGGMKIEFGEYVIDGSVRKNLEMLENKLVNS